MSELKESTTRIGSTAAASRPPEDFAHPPNSPKKFPNSKVMSASPPQKKTKHHRKSVASMTTIDAGMPQRELQLCRDVVLNLSSDKHEDNNYLFLRPFDLTETPGYMEVVTKVMSLSTLSENLEDGRYSNRKEFFMDAHLIFANAIAYHGDQVSSQWVADSARKMLEILRGQELASVPLVLASVPLVLLPTDGKLETWEAFVDANGYDISKEQAKTVKAWVKVQSLDKVWITEQIKFFKQICRMRSSLDRTPRDIWTRVLPLQNAPNYDFCCLILMVATPLVTDTQIIEVFGPLFLDNYVDSKWILEQGESKLEKMFAPLGRQKDTAKYVCGIARNWKFMPRDYRLLLDFVGVGPKVAIVTIQECLGLHQGVACDIHMVRIFKALGWMPPPSLSIFDISTSKKDYELARAAIEGWFPHVFWGQLNSTWAGLGQLFRGGTHTLTEMEKWILREVTDWNSSLRAGDMERLRLIQREYQKK